MDLIHSNISGPMLVKSLRGLLYYVTFIDDFSSKTWIYLLKEKYVVFDKFWEFKVEVEKLIVKRIRILGFNNGGEYTSKEHVDFYKKARIKRELIVSYNPEQNGVAKRKNISIEEYLKDMLHDFDLKLFLWGEESQKNMYIQN